MATSELPATHLQVVRTRAELREALAKRLASLASRERLRVSDEAVLARLLLSLAHDWALGGTRLLVFKNKHKTPQDRKPDFRICIEVPFEDETQAPVGSVSDDDVAF